MSLIAKYLGQHAPQKPALADKLPSAVELTKVDAAFNQIMAAIEMLLRGQYECAVTLAGAAEEMLPKTPQSVHGWLMQAPVPDELQDHDYAAFNETMRATFWNTERNWLKHDKQPNVVKVHRLDAEAMIVRAVSHLPEMRIDPEHDDLLRTLFGLWRHDLGWKPPSR